nr:bifunctional 4-hydroxy-2-oxoglutarate aldolase/2-dehydro-3-deoxy-phosphogluconate aldolase [uncultured Caproiciproducens sp.]
MDMREIIKSRPLLAIMRNVPLEKTLDYAGAVIKGGVTFFEVALNSANALEQIGMLRQKFGDKAMFGAGTAITVDLAKVALDAGAQFLLSPSTNEDVLSYCSDNDIYFLPGVLTPTDVAVCLRYGFKTMKLFPAGDMPRSYVKSLKGPFNDTEYVAIGGVHPENLQEFFHAGCIGAGLSSNMMPKEVVASGDWEKGSAYVANILAKLK